MADDSSKGHRESFRDKAARVYGSKPESERTANSSISVDRGFTVTFTEQERIDLDRERSRIRERLTGSAS